MPDTEPSVDDKVYECTCPDGERRSLSMMDLLEQFRQKEFLQGGVSRISDLHLKCGAPPYYRLDNEMVPWSERPEDRLTEDIVRRLVTGLIAPERRALMNEIREVDASFSLPDLSFRINVYRDRLGLAAAIRVLPTEVPPIESIGFPTSTLGIPTRAAVIGPIVEPQPTSLRDTKCWGSIPARRQSAAKSPLVRALLA